MENLLTNPGFETGNLNSWATGSGSPQVQSTNPHTGTYGAQGTGNGTGNVTILYQNRVAEAGVEYGFAVWVKNATGAGHAGCRVFWSDASWNGVGATDQALAASTDWTKASGVATAPAGTAYASLYLDIRPDNAATVYFDDAEFYRNEASEPPSDRPTAGALSRLGALSYARVLRVAVKG